MVGIYVEIIKITEQAQVTLSNGDKLFKFNGWCLDRKSTKYARRLGHMEGFKEAVEAYEDLTSNVIVGDMDVTGVERILSSPGLEWMALER